MALFQNILGVQEYSSNLIFAYERKSAYHCVYCPENGDEREKIED